MPVTHRSPNSIPPAQTYIAFLLSVTVGARRFAQTSWLRGDRALHGLLGIDRFPSDDTIRNLFLRFGMGEVQRFFEPMTEWMMERLPQRSERHRARRNRSPQGSTCAVGRARTVASGARRCRFL